MQATATKLVQGYTNEFFPPCSKQQLSSRVLSYQQYVWVLLNRNALFSQVSSKSQLQILTDYFHFWLDQSDEWCTLNPFIHFLLHVSCSGSLGGSWKPITGCWLWVKNGAVGDIYRDGLAIHTLPEKNWIQKACLRAGYDYTASDPSSPDNVVLKAFEAIFLKTGRPLTLKLGRCS